MDGNTKNERARLSQSASSAAWRVHPAERIRYRTETGLNASPNTSGIIGAKSLTNASPRPRPSTKAPRPAAFVAARRGRFPAAIRIFAAVPTESARMITISLVAVACANMSAKVASTDPRRSRNEGYHHLPLIPMKSMMFSTNHAKRAGQKPSK